MKNIVILFFTRTLLQDSGKFVFKCRKSILVKMSQDVNRAFFKKRKYHG